MSNCATVVREHKGGAAKKLVLDNADGGFWQRVASHVAITMCPSASCCAASPPPPPAPARSTQAGSRWERASR
eukprot:106422-Prymnesium_polylepis.1